MSRVLAMFLMTIFALAILAGVAAWIATVIYGFKAISFRKSGVRLWTRETLWNPANILLHPEFLTAKGLAYRRKCFISVLVFFLTVGSSLLFGAVTGTLK